MTKKIEKIINHIINEEKSLATDMLENYILNVSKKISERFDEEDNIVDDRTASIIDDMEEIEAEEFYSDIDLNEEEEEVDQAVSDLENELIAHEISDIDVADRVTSLEDQMQDLRNQFDDIIGAETVPDYGNDGFDSLDEIEGLATYYDEIEGEEADEDGYVDAEVEVEDELEEGKTFKHSSNDDYDDDEILSRIARKKEDRTRRDTSREKRHIDDVVTESEDDFYVEKEDDDWHVFSPKGKSVSSWSSKGEAEADAKTRNRSLNEEDSGDFELEPFEIDLEGDEFVGDSDEKIEIETESPIVDIAPDKRWMTKPVEYAPSTPGESADDGWETGPIYKNMNNTSEDYFDDYFETARKKSIMSDKAEEEAFPEDDARPLFPPVNESRRRKV